MANAKVMQQSRSFQRSQERQENKNMFDLSYDVKTTFTMGKLVPFLVKETMPDDEWFIRGEFMFRFAPLYLPIMHRVNMSADYFYIPYRILWPKQQTFLEGAEFSDGWEFFIMNQNNGFAAPAIPVTVINPYDTDPGDPTYKAYELTMYMGFPTRLDLVAAQSPFTVTAFYLNAYYAIYDQYYRNDQIQDRTWSQLTAGMNVQIGMPANPTLLYDYLSCKYRNWNRDYFTSATPLPQLGEDVKIPLVDADALTVAGTPLHGATQWLKIADDTNPGLNSPLKTSADGETLLGTGSIPVYLDIQGTAGSVAQLRQALMLQEYLERAMRAGDNYDDHSFAFFGVRPFKGTIQQPQFIGGKKGKVIISEVLSTTETATLKVGNYAGQAILLESVDGTISYNCDEFGVIIGIVSVYPDSSYMQGIDKMWFRSLYTDYAWPQFALIGDQPILNKEVNADLKLVPSDPDYNDSIFGYIPRYSEWRYSNDLYTGAMRTTFISFHLGRLLNVNNPHTTVLDDLFLQCRPDVTRVFQVTEGEDEIYAHIYNDIKVQRKLPKFGIPAI